ncbi:protein with MYND plus SET domains plus 5 Ank repeats [Cryptosporidium sp. chipmunk genotype I]|uniref:protein with MYND plus SET domains plus 5 Ank repeats n=1 Tax=Cryptosporidium sp. chipmunk genotype I TaxID=1280935 RepID=UPI00351A768D|nr:protein with MYND plus SET domains plus 5 Ank repeats [Cryptosporidium sp. chipmunk genotype I]
MISSLVDILDLPKKSEISHKKNKDLENLQKIFGESKNGRNSLNNSELKEADDSADSYKKAVESLLEICRSLVRQGDSLLAIKQIKRFLFAEPRSLESHSFISLLYMKIGNYFKSYEHIMGVRFMTSDNDYDAKIASGSILDTLIFQICRLPLGLKSKSLIGFNFDDELPFDERKLEYISQYRLEKVNFPPGFSSTTLDKFTTPISNSQINVGDLVHVEEPYALAPELPSNLSIQTTCFHCLREREVYDHAFSCSVHPNTCPFVFCRWECMVKHSRRHELECEFIGEIIVISNQYELPVSFLLLALRCLIQTHLDSVSLLTKTEGVSQKLLELPSYSDIIEIISTDLFSIFDQVSREFIRLIPVHLRLYFSRKELRSFLITLYSNKLPITITSASSAFNSSPVPVSTGLGFFEKASKFQHSCIPSCVYYMNDENKLCIRSAYNIPENANLTISYILDLYQPTFKRKSIINSPKVFACMCSRCLDDSENELYLEGIRCPFCIIGSFVPSPFFKKIEMIEPTVSQSNLKVISKNILTKKSNIFSRERPVKDGFLVSSGIKAEDKMSPDIKTLCERARINCKSGEIQIKWKCSNCGEFSNEINTYCNELISKMENHYKIAINSFNDGKDIEARKLFEKFINNFSLIAHNNHYLIYNSRSHLVGLYNFSNSNDSKMSYKYCKPIIVSSNKVFPGCYHEKVHLFLNLADIIYKKEMIQKVSQRGVFNNSKDLIMECSWLSLYNSMVCYGPKSPVYYYCLSRMRLYSSILGVITPPSNMRIRIASIDLFSNINREILGNSTVSKSADYLSTLSEYSALLFIASIKGHIMGIAQLLVGQVKDILLNQVTYLPTGLNLLGMAASNLRDDVCALLLEEGSDLFFKNEYGITPIHALCTYPGLEEESLDINNDKKAAIIARDMIRRAITLDIGKNSKSDQKENSGQTEHVEKYVCVRKMYAYTGNSGGKNMPERGSNRYKLLYGKTIKWLGSNTPLHIAAFKGRRLLCSELIHGGTDPNVENIELATPLHLASLEGHIETVDILLKYGSEVDKENYQGNTPLLLGIYGLKLETVRLLLEKGASLSHRSDTLRMNAMHMLALGLCCNTTLSFQLPKKLDDLPLITHNGYNNKDLKTYIYSMGTSHTGFGNNSSTKILSIPIHTPIAEFLYISPREMLIRLKNCFDIITFLNSVYDLSPMLIQRDVNGFTPFELLNSSWNDFLKLRNEALLNQGLWYSSLSEEDKISTEELWSHIMQRVERLLEKFRAEEKIYDLNDDDPDLELPLPKKEYKGIPELELSDKSQNKHEYLVRKGYLEPIVMKKGYCGSYSIGSDSTIYTQGNIDNFQIKELKELIMKRRKEHMEMVLKKDKLAGKGGLNSYVKMIPAKSKSILGGVKSSTLLNPKSTDGKAEMTENGKMSKSPKKLGLPLSSPQKSLHLAKNSLSSSSISPGKKNLMPKSELGNTSTNTASPKQLVPLNKKDAESTTKKLVMKTVLKPNNLLSSPQPKVLIKTPPAVGVTPKPLIPGAKLGGVKLDLSNVKVATPKKIEIKTNLIQPKTVAKIVVKSKLVPKKL